MLHWGGSEDLGTELSCWVRGSRVLIMGQVGSLLPAPGSQTGDLAVGNIGNFVPLSEPLGFPL